LLNFKAKARCYFLDLGLAYYFLNKTGKELQDIDGIINENFIYLDLRKRIWHPSSIAFEMPAFATIGNGEIDAKGNTKGGINENIFTIPLYGISKFVFDDTNR